MDCNRTRKLLSEYADGALSGDAKARLEEHIAGCPACAEELESLRRVVAGVRGLGKVAAPDDLLRGVMSGIERTGPAPARSVSWPAAWMDGSISSIRTEPFFQTAGLPHGA